MSEENGPDLSETTLYTDPVPYRFRPANGDGPYPLLVMLHGRGANEGDIFELVPYVSRRVLVAAPRAPEVFSDDPRGSFAWFLQPPTDANQALFEKQLNVINRVIERVTAEYPVDQDKIVIGGFSQGAAMSVVATILWPDKFAGAIAHSGFLPAAPDLQARLPLIKGKPFFVAYGSEDKMILPARNQDLLDNLNRAVANVTYREYPIEHATSPQSRRDLADWLHYWLGIES